jgi:HK97 family phage portal protein
MSLFGLFESRASIENPAVPLTNASLLAMLGGMPTDSGMQVTEVSSMRMSAVFRGVSLISGLCGSLPILVVRKGTKEPASHPLIDEPHPEMTPVEFWGLSGAHRALWGNFYAQKVYKRGGKIDHLVPLLPNRVTPGRAKPIPANPSGKVFKVVDDDGQSHDLTSNEILHIPLMSYDGICGISPVRAAAQAVGLSLGAEKYGAKLFGSGNLMSGLLQTEQKLSQEQAETLQERWRQRIGGVDNAHKVAVLDAGAKFQSLTMPNDEAQLLESRDFQITELARFFGVPPYLMFQTDKVTSWGTGLEQQATGFVKFDLHPRWLATTEQRITKELLSDELEARYNVDDLMRGDSISRSQFYRVMYEMGAFSANEIRALEDMPARPGGDDYMEPMPATAVNSPMGADPVIGGSSMGPPDRGN